MSDGTRFADFARISADWFWETDSEDRFTYFSVPVTRAGIVLDGRLGMRRRDGVVQQPENLARLAALEAVIVRREPFRDFVFRVGNRTGQTRWCSISGEPRHDSAGTFLGYRGAGRDVSEQIEAQREVELQGLALQAILRAMPDGVRLVDKSDAVLAVNDQIYEILSIPNRASQRDAASTFESTLDLARRGEYGPGDPETLAHQRGEDLRRMIDNQRALTYQRQLKTGRWVECRHRALDDGARLSLYRDITDAKAHEAELERQSAMMSTVTANMDGGIVVLDKENRLIAWNDGVADLIGVDPALARRGATLRELLVSQAKAGEFGSCDPEAEADRRIASYHGEQAVVSERTRPNGRIIELRRNPIPGGGSVTIYIDITERRRAEQQLKELNATLERRIAERTEALAESERFQRTLLANVPGIVYRCRNDRDWTMEFVSEGCRALLGFAPDDLVGGSTTYNELIHPDDREMVWQAVQRDFAADRPFELEYRVRHADGSYRWVWDRAHAIRVAGKVEAMEGFVIDITQRKQAERELARVRDNLSDAVESVNHGIMLFDRDRRLVLFNRRVLGHYLGPSDLLIIGNRFEENFAAAVEHGRVAVPPGRTASEFIAERLAKFERASGEITERRMPDGRILHISDHRTLSGGTVSMGVDVTERVRIEQRLREVQRMEAIGQLTGGLAHDFNNYLAVVIGNLDLLADCRFDDPEAPKLIEGALAGAQRGAELTRSLLAFSRRQPLSPRNLDVGQRIGDVARLLKRAIGEKITLDVEVAPGLWPVEIDAAQLDSAIVNLANNARDAMPDGGTLTLAVRNAAAGIAEQPAGGHVLIEMIDTGRGMDEATQARAFEPFFSTKGPGHGTGLGLSMVHGFVHQSGGAIRLLSAKGRGTTVQLFLPRAARPVSRPAPAGAALPRGTESVLVVEDNADVRAIVVTQIKSLGYRVVETDSGDAALALLEERPGEFDLLISDMVMPGETDGLGLARMARERWPKLAVLLTTGFSDVVDDGGDGKAVDFGVLRKPYRKADIARAMRAALAVGGA
ncbi:MAG: PAS domain S-box protein [Rhodospirillales bacterium]|nr:PAS domain S-box protein [Rhodospirillales bacterium]